MPVAATGDALDWVTAIASVMSSIGVLAALVLLRPQLQEFRANAMDRERAVAMKVTAWAEKRSPEGRWIVAHNASSQPIRDIRLWLVPGGEVPDEESEPPWDRRPTTRRAVLAPHDELRYLIPNEAMRGPAPSQRPPVEIVFREDSGRLWWRDAMGRLVSLSRRHMRGQDNLPDSQETDATATDGISTPSAR